LSQPEEITGQQLTLINLVEKTQPVILKLK